MNTNQYLPENAKLDTANIIQVNFIHAGYLAKMDSKEAYRLTYMTYRSLSIEANSTRRWWMKGMIDQLHQKFPKIAAAAHTSFSMRALYNS